LNHANLDLHSTVVKAERDLVAAELGAGDRGKYRSLFLKQSLEGGKKGNINTFVGEPFRGHTMSIGKLLPAAS